MYQNFKLYMVRNNYKQYYKKILIHKNKIIRVKYLRIQIFRDLFNFYVFKLLKTLSTTFSYVPIYNVYNCMKVYCIYTTYINI